jgi:hypothetical protein
VHLNIKDQILDTNNWTSAQNMVTTSIEEKNGGGKTL